MDGRMEGQTLVPCGREGKKGEEKGDEHVLLTRKIRKRPQDYLYFSSSSATYCLVCSNPVYNSNSTQAKMNEKRKKN